MERWICLLAALALGCSSADDTGLRRGFTSGTGGAAMGGSDSDSGDGGSAAGGASDISDGGPPASGGSGGSVGYACGVGDTRACVGPGACEGGQACLADRSGFSACECASPGAGGQSGAGGQGSGGVTGNGGKSGDGGSASVQSCDAATPFKTLGRGACLQKDDPIFTSYPSFSSLLRMSCTDTTERCVPCVNPDTTLPTGACPP